MPTIEGYVRPFMFTFNIGGLRVEYVIWFIIMIGVYFYGRSSVGTTLSLLRQSVDAKGFFRCLIYEHLPLYQLVFDKVIEEIGCKNTRLTDSEIIKIRGIINTFSFSKSIILAYLVIMADQYFLADEFEREQNSKGWVRIATHQKQIPNTDFFPTATSLEGNIFERIGSLKDN